MSNSSEREKIALKIKALLEKTVENGCTEGEAMAAASKAALLMKEHDLTYKDCTNLRKEIEDEPHGTCGREFKVHDVRFCCSNIADYLNCFYWRSGKNMIFFGSKTNTELAHHMVDLIRTAMDTEWARYNKRADHNVHGKTARKSFMMGMVNRICDRIEKLKNERVAEATGNALVIVKDDVVNQQFTAYKAVTGTKISTTRQPYTMHQKSYAAGDEAGKRVDLGGKKLQRTPLGIAEKKN